MQNFRALGAPPPDPVPPAAGGSALDPPNSPPPLRISYYAPAYNAQLNNQTFYSTLYSVLHKYERNQS